MENVEQREDDTVDLGAASVETKGQAIIDVDVGGGQLRFVAGISDD